MERGVGLARCEAVDERIELLDMREAAGEFAELSLRGIDVEKVAAVWPFLDLRDLSTPAGKLDVVADPELGHKFRSFTDSSIADTSSSPNP